MTFFKIFLVATILFSAYFIVARSRKSRRVAPGRTIEHRPTASIRGNDLFDFEIVGEASYQRAISNIAGPKTEDGAWIETIATLRCENTNAHDPKAVRVEIDRMVVGYLSRKDARAYRAALKAAGRGEADQTARAAINGGWKRRDLDDEGIDEGLFGVKLDMIKPLEFR